MRSISRKHLKNKSLMICSQSRISKKDAEDAYCIIQIETMKRTNAENIHYKCTMFKSFNKKSINKLNYREKKRKLDKRLNMSKIVIFMANARNIKKQKF